MGKLKQSLIDACEKLDWTVREYEDGSVELEKYSPAGEDFIVSASAETFVRDVKQYAADFDIDEHIEMWVEAKTTGKDTTIPSVRRLCKDAEDIDEMLQELAAALNALPIKDTEDYE